MDLLKPENGLLKYGIEVSEKKKEAKSSNLLLGKKWRIKTNLHRGSPNIFRESAMGDGGAGGGGAEDSDQRPL